MFGFLRTWSHYPWTAMLAQAQPSSSLSGNFWDFFVQQGLLGVVCFALGAYQLYKDREWAKREAALLAQINTERDRTSTLLENTIRQNVTLQERVLQLSESVQISVQADGNSRELQLQIKTIVSECRDDLKRLLSQLPAGKTA